MISWRCSSSRRISETPTWSTSRANEKARRVLRREANPYVVVFALWLLVFAASSQIMIISPILPQIGEELGITDSLLGTLVSAYSLMVGIFA